MNTNETKCYDCGKPGIYPVLDSKENPIAYLCAVCAGMDKPKEPAVK